VAQYRPRAGGSASGANEWLSIAREWVALYAARALAQYSPRDDKADGDFGAGARLRIEVARGEGKAGTFLRFMVGNETVFQVDGEGRVWAKGGVLT
jgi:hypothetical protein